MPGLKTKAAGLIVAAAAVLLTAACGGGSGSDNANGSANGGGPDGGGNGRNSEFTAYVQCLSKNGVTITMPSGGPRTRPSGAGRPSGFPRPSGSAGARGGGGFPGAGGAFGKPAGVDDATWEKAQAACASVRPSFGVGQRNGGGGRNAAFQNCMKEHGVTTTGNLSTADPTVQKALDTCKVLRQAEPSASPTA